MECRCKIAMYEFRIKFLIFFTKNANVDDIDLFIFIIQNHWK